MNIRKPIDYRVMFMALDSLMSAELPQMKLYCAMGRLVSDRPEKGVAVAETEYLQCRCPNHLASLRAMCAECGIFADCMEMLYDP